MPTRSRPDGSPAPDGGPAARADASLRRDRRSRRALAGRDLPPEGGDTQFANTAMGNLGAKPGTEEQKRERPPASHPLVRTHPDTGVKSLCLGLHTSHVVGMDRAEGRAVRNYEMAKHRRVLQRTVVRGTVPV